jgi:hypothetical protein
MMAKIDFKKEYKTLYQPSAKEVVAVDVPAFNFLMLDGHGDPNTNPGYGEAVSALYSLAYTIKFSVKKKTTTDFGVMPLEGLWWVEDMRLFDTKRKDDWLWTMMIMQPPVVTRTVFEDALTDVSKKKPNPLLAQVRFEKFVEGCSAQIMHIGPYSAEGPNIARLHAFIEHNGNALRGKHHEIYLSDPGRTQPEKLKTVVRQPFA